MKKLFTIVVCMIALSANSQITFKSDFYFGTSCNDMAELNNHYLFNWGHLYFLNKFGILDTQLFYKYNPNFQSIYKMERYDSSNFIMAANYQDTGCNSINIEPVIFKTDLKGFVNFQVVYVLNNFCSNISKITNLQEDFCLLISGLCQNVNYSLTGKFYLFKTDSTLVNIQWAKNFINHKGAISFIREVNSNFTLLGINIDTAGACLARLDSMGNVLWCKSYFRPKGMITDALVDTDGNIMCAGFTDTITWGNGPLPSNFSTKLFLMKVDTAGNVIWCKGYDDVHPAHFYIRNHPLIKPTLDGNYIIGAAKATNLIVNPNIGGHTLLIKVDGNGDTLWTNGYGYQNRATYFSNMLPVSDGGYLLTGDFYGAISWPFGGCYVYKTDSLGNTSCGNLFDPVSITPLFPTDSNVVLLSVDDSVSIIYSTIGYDTAPLAPYAEDCIAVGMQQPQQNSGYQIYPNPTKGEFKIEVPSPLKRDSFVTVYNSIGKIVLQHAIKTEKDLQLDLSKYGKGIYLVKVSEGDKDSSSKVVVE